MRGDNVKFKPNQSAQENDIVVTSYKLWQQEEIPKIEIFEVSNTKTTVAQEPQEINKNRVARWKEETKLP